MDIAIRMARLWCARKAAAPIKFPSPIPNQKLFDHSNTESPILCPSPMTVYRNETKYSATYPFTVDVSENNLHPDSHSSKVDFSNESSRKYPHSSSLESNSLSYPNPFSSDTAHDLDTTSTFQENHGVSENLDSISENDFHSDRSILSKGKDEMLGTERRRPSGDCQHTGCGDVVVVEGSFHGCSDSVVDLSARMQSKSGRSSRKRQ